MFARLYPVLNRSVLKWGPLPEGTIPELIGIRPIIVIAAVAVLIVAVLRWLSF
ncbi:hypothetical protein ASZ90_012162 [hydrocarbon metagenome]